MAINPSVIVFTMDWNGRRYKIHASSVQLCTIASNSLMKVSIEGVVVMNEAVDAGEPESLGPCVKLPPTRVIIVED